MQKLSQVIRSFLADETGAAGLEFVTSLPLLVGVMVFTSEYGRALQARMILDSATQDVTRFLARAPAVTDNSGDPRIEQWFIDTAQDMLEARLRGKVDMKGTPTMTSVASGFRTDFYVIEVQTEVSFSMPLLDFINSMIDLFFTFNFFTERGADQSEVQKLDTGLIMVASQQARWIGDADLDAISCSNLDRGLGLCS